LPILIRSFIKERIQYRLILADKTKIKRGACKRLARLKMAVVACQSAILSGHDACLAECRTASKYSSEHEPEQLTGEQHRWGFCKIAADYA